MTATSFPYRLTNARKMCGLSLDKLASELGDPFNKQLLHRFESGGQEPDSEQLSLLSSCLNQPIEYFYRPLGVSMGQIDFRKTQKVGKKAVDRIIEIARDYFERYLELEDIIGNKQSHPRFQLVQLNLHDKEGIDQEAKRIREELWKIGSSPLASIIHILEEYGIKIFVIDNLDGVPLDTSFSGFSTIINDGVGCIVINGNEELPLVRRRFTLLHEFSHLHLSLAGMPERDGEKLCDALAGALLISASTLKDMFGPRRTAVSFYELKIAKKLYGASLSSIMYSMYSNGIISQSYFTTQMIQYNMRYKRAEKDGFDGSEQSDRFKRLLIRAVSMGIISESKAAALIQKKTAEICDLLDSSLDESSSN